jgi:hypothetical protein
MGNIQADNQANGYLNQVDNQASGNISFAGIPAHSLPGQSANPAGVYTAGDFEEDLRNAVNAYRVQFVDHDYREYRLRDQSVYEVDGYSDM